MSAGSHFISRAVLGRATALGAILAAGNCTASDASQVVVSRAPVAPACYILTFADSSRAPAPFAAPPIRLALLAPGATLEQTGSTTGPAYTSIKPTREPGPQGEWRLSGDSVADIVLRGDGEEVHRLRVRFGTVGSAGAWLTASDSVALEARRVDCAAMGFRVER